MWGDGKTVTVVFPAYNEAANIARAVRDFLGVSAVDEVLVVDNNSRDGTGDLAREAGARVVLETKQGYGNALQRGLREATGDYIVLAEPDGTFVAKDVVKLLAYADELDMVMGTRTTRELIWEQANMGWFLRVGNWAVAKLLQLLFDGPSLSDCGCTLRLIRREAARQIVGSAHRRRLALPAGDGRAGAPERPAHRRGARQLPGARRRVQDHRLAGDHAQGRHPDDRADPGLPPQELAPRD